MRIKSYFADSVQEAIEKARVELGPDAMLMNTKKTGFELRALGSFEVVLGLPGQVETVKRSMSRQQRTAATVQGGPSGTVGNIRSWLMAGDISEDLAQEIAEAVELQAFAWKQSSSGLARDFEMIPAETLEPALAAELDRRFQVAPELGRPEAKQKIVMFVGPSGAGKTTSLIKLGLRCGLQARLPMHILSLDTLRVGGWEHLAA